MLPLIKIENGEIIKYPYSYDELKKDNPNISFPKYENMSEQEYANFGVYLVHPNTMPIVDPFKYTVVNDIPAIEDGLWKKQYIVQEKTEEEKEDFKNFIQNRLSDGIKARLNEFAMSRGYDSIMSACSYTNSTVAKYREDAQTCVSLRDQTWSTFYDIIAEANSGTRNWPLEMQDIEDDLPALVWSE